ncbi:methyltransferase domain-containing protein [Shewanella sp. JM162201]|uniref:Methyltransferase domain-containing protein n=1 Tax=Shewanella jiangmenensis TaxID=2837387 RepID=A0ABS5V3B2_9GAMM|nr:class I SAM-dependent methyltransferase [Shewanella jiangmenensis]MBT1444936.1 methyltransferase domain-containing protein [Shewanella jiangmenensis]
MQACAICHGTEWEQFSTISFGVWQSNNGRLWRDTEDYPLGCCAQCGHVQNLAQYNEALLQRLYFHSPQEEVYWSPNLIGSDFPYHQMVSMFADELPEAAVIADLGCGPGKLLNACRDRLPKARLHGADFNDRCALEGISYQSANLSDVDALKALFPHQSLDLICSSHTLEHLPNPRAFLLAIKPLLKNTGMVFIEVPDFSTPHPWEISGQSSLVNQQHIHYFSKDSLAVLAGLCGYEILKTKQFVTGFIPRLQLLLRPLSKRVLGIVKQVQADIQSKHQSLLETISTELEAGGDVHLWGVGADLYQLMGEPRFDALLATPNLTLHDAQWAGHELAGKTIAPSAALREVSGKIVITPSLAETRTKMNAVSKGFQADVIDSYAQSSATTTELSLCALCASNDWQPLETLISGNWDKSGPQLKRQTLSLPIAQCQHCGHVQIAKPYGPREFELLYFSSEGAPDMWPATGPHSPYDDMVDLFKDRLVDFNTIADFGCGAGVLLDTIRQQKPDAHFTGFDFKSGVTPEGIPITACDLNAPGDILQVARGAQFDLIVSSHVLEHLIQPVLFLSSLKQRLKHGGILFIEVPDSGYEPDNCLHETNLIHGQHIHYYTEESLLRMAAVAGFECLKLRRFHTGSIPRLQLLLSPCSPSPLSSPVQNSAHDSIKQRFDGYRAMQARMMTTIRNLMSSGTDLALWGVGGDLFLLCHAYPELESLIGLGHVRLFDAALADKTYLGAVICASDKLVNTGAPILLTPIYWPTRSRMHQLAAAWSIEVIDPYQVTKEMSHT